MDIPLIEPPKTKRTAEIIKPDEANKFFLLTQKLCYRVLLFTPYSMDLRLGEVLRLQVGDIDAIN